VLKNKIINVGFSANSLIIAFYFIFGTSTIFYFLGGHRIVAFLLFFFYSLFLIILDKNRLLSRSYVIAFLFFITLSLVSSVYWSHIRYAFTPVFFFISLMLLYTYRLSDIKQSVNIISNVLLVLLILSTLGFVYAYLGYPGIRVGTNPDGRGVTFYLSTLTNAAYNFGGRRFIRPSAIYDEPGSLSLIVCMCVVCRHLLKMDQKKSIYLLLFGFITLSAAHLLFTIVYVFSLVIMKINKNLLTASLKFKYFVWLTIGIVFLVQVFDVINALLFSRIFTLNIETIAGNRLEPFLNALSLISINTFLWGLDPICISDANRCSNLYGRVRDNPLTELVTRGIFSSLLYYALILYFLVVSVLDKRMVILLGVVVLMMQRPMALNVGTEVFLALTIVIISKTKNRS